MEREHEAILAGLLTGERVLALSVLVDGRPYVGMLPFVAWPEREALLIQASDLARHAKGLGSGAPYSALLHVPDAPDADPRRLPRATVEGEVERIERGGADWQAARDLYLGRFPASRMTFQLGDFHLYRLAVRRGRFFVGFAKTYNLTPGLLARLPLRA